MEKYFEKIEDRFQDMQFSIEAVIYENELKYAFTPATEADSTIASPTSSDDSSGSDSKQSDNTAANKIADAGKTADKAEKKAEDRDQATTEREGKGEDSPKTRQEIIDTIKEISSKLAQFIREHVANLSSSMSQMLKDNETAQKEIEALIKSKKLNDNLVFKDYNYDTQFLTDFTNAVKNSFASYNKQYNSINPTIREVLELVADKKYDDAKTKIQGLTNDKPTTEGNTENTENKGPDAETVAMTNSANNVTVESPVKMVAKSLNLTQDNIGDINVTNIKKYAYKKYKGISDNDNGPKKYVLKENHNRLDTAIEYIRKEYHERLKDLNSNRDNIRQCAQSYENLCSELLKVQGMDEGLKVALNSLMNKLSTHLNEIVALNDFSLTAIKERAVAAEILIRSAYSSPKKLEADKSTAVNVKDAKPNNEGK